MKVTDYLPGCNITSPSFCRTFQSIADTTIHTTCLGLSSISISRATSHKGDDDDDDDEQTSLADKTSSGVGFVETFQPQMCDRQ